MMNVLRKVEKIPPLLHESLQLVSLGTYLEESQLGDWTPLTKAVPGTQPAS